MSYDLLDRYYHSNNTNLAKDPNWTLVIGGAKEFDRIDVVQ
jgi:hypothetical protein